MLSSKYTCSEMTIAMKIDRVFVVQKIGDTSKCPDEEILFSSN